MIIEAMNNSLEKHVKDKVYYIMNDDKELFKTHSGKNDKFWFSFKVILQLLYNIITFYKESQINNLYIKIRLTLIN